ncbi:MAG TPA: circularly permuted type 2 ATP-grasp protein [Steroidobacteraceae bacterium]|nr:circularly permuted type 2 ATP-grasp protein [Steroidobacteraceae bacterium]
MAPTRDSLKAYAADPHRYDELLDRDGNVREHWQPLIQRLLTEGPEAARRGVELARRLIVENGVTYNVYADPQGRDRPWGLDPLPMLISSSEWRGIEAGVIQRAELLNALLADLYGPQELLADGTIPPELPFGHPNYLWPCRGIRPPGGNWLHVYAVDLARAPDGRWWVLGDRTQTPSGPGYALENRQIVSRVYPELAKDVGARPIGGFFAGLRASLLSSAEGTEPPLAVVLTPGHFNETYFEHAYLARHLGLPLVEGSDLTVRGETLYLKTLSGLKRVHAILRRLDDDFCDPVELRADSALGVPGLLSVVRAGRVVLANGLGTGVLESAAWLGFLPSIAERMLGQKLRLPSVATWWCGEEPALDYVAEHLDHLVIKCTFPNQKFEPVFGEGLAGPAREALLARLRARPYAYVAQERVQFSQAPVWRGTGAPHLDARSLGIRVYAIATAQGYAVMPGGMARIASDKAIDIVSTQRGGGSKDVWVLSRSALSGEDTPADEQLARVQVRHDELPSGLVESLFWLGRYAERCEDKTRLLRATFAVRPDPKIWAPALASCRHFGVLAEDAEPAEGLFDAEEPLGLAADLGRLAWSATRSRSRLSAEHWRSLNVLQRQFHEAEAANADPRETLDRLLLGLAAFAGFTLDDMTQDDGWRLMMLGRQLERLQFLSALLADSLAEGRMPLRGELEWLLDVGGSTITYRTRYLASPRLVPTLQLLVYDDSNPRSLAFHWRGVRRTLVQLAASLGGAVEDVMEDSIHRLGNAALGELDGDDGVAVGARLEMAEALGDLHATAGRLCDLISMRHFSHTDRDVQTVAA